MKSITVRIVDHKNDRTDELEFLGVDQCELGSIMPMIYSFVNNEKSENKSAKIGPSGNATSHPASTDKEFKFIAQNPKKEYVDIRNYGKQQLVYTTCKNCNDEIIAKLEANAKDIVCRKCSTTNNISTKSKVANFYCTCGTKLHIPRVHNAGDTIHAKCPKCKEKLEASFDEFTDEYVGY